MTKDDMIRALAERSGMTLVASKEAFNATVAVIEAGLLAGEDISLGSVGKLKIQHRKARSGKDFDGKVIQIPARKGVRMVLSAGMVTALN
jgi:DNA-binding protein HU-beta